jgi:hypothetical protein
VERELVLRLASVLWRLRRSTGIETALLQLNKPNNQRLPSPDPVTPMSLTCSLGGRVTNGFHTEMKNVAAPAEVHAKDRRECTFDAAVNCPDSKNAALARRFLRLAKVDNGAFERLSRYETALWRQTAQLLWLLNSLRRPRREDFPLRRHIPFLFGRRG